MAAAGRGTRLLVLLSKADKLSRAERPNSSAHTRRHARRGGPDGAQVMLFSSKSGEGVEETRALLEAWLRAVREE